MTRTLILAAGLTFALAAPALADGDSAAASAGYTLGKATFWIVLGGVLIAKLLPKKRA
jgi:hypothetical protein